MDPRRSRARHALTLGPDADGLRFDVAIARLLPSLSRSRLKALIDAGQALVDGNPARPSARVRAGQSVSVVVPEPAAAVPRPEDLPLHVVHEDGDLLVVDKPAGMVVHPGAGRSSGTLVNALLHHVRDLSGVGGVLRPGIVHRLDAGTSGLLVVAKNDVAHRALARQFENRTVAKEYLAVVHGTPPRREGAIDAAVGRDPWHRQKMSLRSRRGREARSSYTVEQVLDGASLVRVKIQTGRTHQIRVHMGSLGCPLVGDRTYGGAREPSARRPEAREAIRAFPRPALHAARLCFRHPSTGASLDFESSLPHDMASLILSLQPVK